MIIVNVSKLNFVTSLLPQQNSSHKNVFQLIFKTFSQTSRTSTDIHKIAQQG